MKLFKTHFRQRRGIAMGMLFLTLLLAALWFSLPRGPAGVPEPDGEPGSIPATYDPAKENLIIVHSFPTNSILLSGLTEYLEDYFNVYFIDLPGFTKEVPPLSDINFDGYSRFVEREIEELNLDSYLVSGVSFGFYVINNIAYDSSRCKGIIAIEPYIGSDSLKTDSAKETFYTTAFVKSIIFLNLSFVVWESDQFKDYFLSRSSYPPDRIDIMFNQIDGRTFFETANLVISTKDVPNFQDLPYVLIINKDDSTIDYNYIVKTFTENTERLLVVHTTVDHYPIEPTKVYFKERVPEEEVKRIFDFISTSNSP